MEKSRAIDLLDNLIGMIEDNQDNDYDTAFRMAIEALKAQLSKEGATKGATSDLISKTETVEHLRRTLDATVPITDYDEGFVDGVEFGVSTVSAMPTIQPQSTTGQLNDGAQSTAQSTNLIERQATIDAVNNAFDRETLLTGLVRSIAVRAIRDMPSAQPEPKEGYWIDKGWDGDWAWQIDGRGNCWRLIECSECGKRVLAESNYCPNCGAKMKGETDGRR